MSKLEVAAVILFIVAFGFLCWCLQPDDFDDDQVEPEASHDHSTATLSIVFYLPRHAGMADSVMRDWGMK